MVMQQLKYSVIKSKKQYFAYCDALEHLLESGATDRNTKDEIELLELLIDKWDSDHNSFTDLDPVELLGSLMKDHQLKAKDIVEILGVSKGYVSDILHYKKGFSKEVIRKLAEHFGVSQEAFNQRYELKGISAKRLKIRTHE